MLTREELEKLAAIPEGEEFYLSLYLTVDPAANPRQEYIKVAKNLLRQELGRLQEAGEHPKAALRSLAAAGDRLLQYLALNQNRFRKGLIVFSDGEEKFWREYHLAVPVRPCLVVDRRLYLKPLAQLFDDYQPFIAVLVDRRKARLFLVQLGEVLVYVEESRPEIPGKHKKGGWRAWEQAKFSRQIEKMVAFHLEDVAVILEELLKKEYVSRIAVGGPVEAVSRFKEILPPWVRERVTAYLSAQVAGGEKDILDQALDLLGRVEREREDEFLEEIADRVHRGDRVSVGLDDVLDSVVQGEVYKLAVAADFERGGFRCPNCGGLFTQARENCYYCGGPLEAVSNFVDFLVQRAVNQGALIEVIRHNQPRLREMGGIAALLRF